MFDPVVASFVVWCGFSRRSLLCSVRSDPRVDGIGEALVVECARFDPSLVVPDLDMVPTSDQDDVPAEIGVAAKTGMNQDPTLGIGTNVGCLGSKRPQGGRSHVSVSHSFGHAAHEFLEVFGCPQRETTVIGTEESTGGKSVPKRRRQDNSSLVVEHMLEHPHEHAVKPFPVVVLDSCNLALRSSRRSWTGFGDSRRQIRITVNRASETSPLRPTSTHHTPHSPTWQSFFSLAGLAAAFAADKNCC